MQCLVIEDEADTARYICNGLEEAGHTATLVRDGGNGLRSEIQELLADGIEQDTEVSLLVAPDGRMIVGNIAGWTMVAAPLDRLTDLAVTRNGRPSLSRLLPRLLPDGSILVVGRDMQDQREIEQPRLGAPLAGGGGAGRGRRAGGR